MSEIKLGLERIKKLLELLDNPHDKLKFVHVAGTNGKGSTSAITASILREAGYKTGMFTSPYTDSPTEMMQINGENINVEILLRLENVVLQKMNDMDDLPSEFECLVAVAFLYFEQQNCDIVVLEVGMGGRLDATNVIGTPEAAILTAIGLDHMEYLGNDIKSIAAEKAGIVKKGGICISQPQAPEAEAVIREKCFDVGSRMQFIDKNDIKPIFFSRTGTRFDYADVRDLSLSLLGKHQLLNAASAIETAKALSAAGWEISNKALRNGLAKAKWPGRFEVVHDKPVFILDAAHNEQAAQVTVKTLKRLFPNQKITFIYGVLSDKNYEEMTALLVPIAKTFYTVTPNNPRALLARDLAIHILFAGGTATACDSVKEGVKQALEASGDDDIICALGSLYILGQVRYVLESFKK
ncbi:MAG: bifunctional folylpolyglutamate synthase/dihydrofolate synthase [Defluviitaleaceae bacterium]|nr:bifunctional folylpolyglutamate synthase/dihydrofolate synthase [Defluviitaleaceae bacterium]